MKLKFSVITFVALFVLAVHELPIEGNFFHKIGVVRKFLHGDLMKEVDVQKKESANLQKQLGSLEVSKKRFLAEGSMIQATSEKIESTLSHSKESEESTKKQVSQLERQVKQQEDRAAQLE